MDKISFTKSLDGEKEAMHDDSASSKTTQRRFIDRLKTDIVFRDRIVHTVMLYWAFITVGWVVGISGPALPDLRLIVQIDLATASWIFTTGCIGYMLGSLTFGFLFDRLNKHLLMMVSTLGFAVFNAVKPYCRKFPVMLVIQLIGYVFCGGIDTGANADIPFIWGSESGPYMQALHMSFCLGAILAPLATEPFLAKNKCVLQTNLSEPNITTYSNDGNSSFQNMTINDSHDHIINRTCQPIFEETRVQYAFLISSCIAISGSFGYMLLFCRFSNVYVFAANAKKQKGVQEKGLAAEDKPKGRHLSAKLKILFLTLLSLLLMTYCIIEDEFGNYLMTFSILWLGWSKETGSYATTVYWTCFIMGRFGGIFISNCYSQGQILTTFISLMVVSIFGFGLSSHFRIGTLVWVFTGFMGFSMSVIVASIFSWTSQNVIKITGKVTSTFLVTASTGVMFFPILTGYMMEHYSPMWLVYILAVVMVTNVAVYVSIRLLARHYIFDNHYDECEIVHNVSENMIKSSGSEVVN